MRPDLPYRNRKEAGRYLAKELARFRANKDVVVLGLTRGGVPVAAEVAAALHAPLDVVVVRKLGVPSQAEMAMGAVAGDETQVLDPELIRASGVTEKALAATMVQERTEVERRERLYRGSRPLLDLRNRTAILVDDGLATGSTMRAAVEFARKRRAKRIVLAVPVASPDGIAKLRDKVEECISLATPDPFFAVGEWYWNFPPVEDAEVVKLLEESARHSVAAA